MDQDLSEVEQKLVEQVETGVPFTGPGIITATIIRDIVLGRITDSPDPRGIQLQNIRVMGTLDLSNVTSAMPIWFENCDLPDGVDLSYSDLGRVFMTNCRMAHPTGAAFFGRQLLPPTLVLSGTAMSGVGVVGALHLQEAEIKGALLLDGVDLSNASGPALDGSGMHVAGSTMMRGAAATGSGWPGTVCLDAATAESNVSFDGTRLHNDSWAAFTADTARVKGVLGLCNGFSATGRGPLGTVRMIDAQLGSLNCTGGTVWNDLGGAILVQSSRIASNVHLGAGFTASGSTYGVSLVGTRIDGELVCSQGTFNSTAGTGLIATQTQVAGSATFTNDFKATGAGLFGAVSLVGARIGNALCFDGATITNTSGPAIYAQRVVVSGLLLMRAHFTAKGSGVAGTIDLLGAEIGGAIDCWDALITNLSGPAIRAVAVHLGGPLTLAGAFIGAVVIADSQIDGTVRFPRTSLYEDNGPALVMRQTRVRQSLEFIDVKVDDKSGSVALDLAQVEVGGTVSITPTCLTDWQRTKVTIDVDGLTCVGLPNGITSAEWLELLRTSMPRYAAQPYQQLAAAERAAGHDSRVRRVLMAQRRDQIKKRALTGRAERLWARFSGIALGYGYQPWPALVGLFLVLSLAGLAAGFLGGWGGLTKVGGGACAVVDRIGYGLDAGTPLITPKAKCETTNTPWGTVLTISGWVFKVLAWAFATLFIAGFTGAVRKT